MEKECERIDGDGHKNDPPVVTNTKVKPNVDASCNAFCFINHIYIFRKWLCCLHFCEIVSEMCYLCKNTQCWHNRRSSSLQIVSETKATMLSERTITRRRLHITPGQLNSLQGAFYFPNEFPIISLLFLFKCEALSICLVITFLPISVSINNSLLSFWPSMTGAFPLYLLWLHTTTEPRQRSNSCTGTMPCKTARRSWSWMLATWKVVTFSIDFHCMWAQIGRIHLQCSVRWSQHLFAWFQHDLMFTLSRNLKTLHRIAAHLHCVKWTVFFSTSPAASSHSLLSHGKFSNGCRGPEDSTEGRATKYHSGCKWLASWLLQLISFFCHNRVAVIVEYFIAI